MTKARSSLGFTLVEMLVAIALMALMGVMAWRGLGSIQGAQIRLAQHTDDTLALQAGLGQWAADLDAIAIQANTPSLAWDGRVLRVLRRGSASPGDGLRVVGWSQRQVDGIAYWLRWQSPSLRTRAELDAAWAQAARWGQNPSNEDQLHEVRISPLSQWQIFYFRNNAWTNPQSSASATDTNALPEGMRLVLTLPAGQVISGVLTRDWARTEGSTPP
ncbi:MAG: prepilin-type N-terminal cleavage/methylation domain-containing protein [Comamonadaceae bacterium]|nr:MAG: prepilin-type N-terminal cleavage/methylation domain-containing protein [Comamonadaceae bacterium]